MPVNFLRRFMSSMASKVVVAESAARSLIEAAAYIANILCEKSAGSNLLNEFDNFIETVGRLPGLYPLCSEKRLAAKGIRKALIGNYVALYVYENDQVTVIALFHQTQDYAKLV